VGAANSSARGATRFSVKVKEYLTAKFDIGEKTGDKADPTQVASDMRNTMQKITTIVDFSEERNG